MRRLLLVFAATTLLAVASADAEPTRALVEQAVAAEAAGDAARALELFLAAEKSGPVSAFVLQKIARQYSDLIVQLPAKEDKRRYAELAVRYSEAAVAAEPTNAVNVLSVAISYGKLALASDTREKVRHSRRVREEAERALQLDPNYAWAHHILGRWHHEVVTLGATARMVVSVFFGGLPPASVEAAVAHLEKAQALEPDELQHALELGFAQLAAGDLPAARASFARGLAMPSRAHHDEPAKRRARDALEKISR